MQKLEKVSPVRPELHPGNARRLSQALDDYTLTMSHAIRQDLKGDLERRAAEEAGILPPLTAAEMYDYLVDTDDEFYNWCFPYCAVKLTRENLGYMHKYLLEQFRRSLNPVIAVQTESIDAEQ